MVLMKRSKAKPGFTLVEMIVVIAVLAILAVIGIRGFSGYLERGRKTRAATDAATLASALNIYNTAVPDAERVIGYAVASKNFTKASGTPPTISAADLKAALITKNILPNLAASEFTDAAENLIWTTTEQLWDANNILDLIGY